MVVNVLRDSIKIIVDHHVRFKIFVQTTFLLRIKYLFKYINNNKKKGKFKSKAFCFNVIGKKKKRFKHF